jgi:hypothetical protein
MTSRGQLASRSKSRDTSTNDDAVPRQGYKLGVRLGAHSATLQRIRKQQVAIVLGAVQAFATRYVDKGSSMMHLMTSVSAAALDGGD